MEVKSCKMYVDIFESMPLLMQMIFIDLNSLLLSTWWSCYFLPFSHKRHPINSTHALSTSTFSVNKSVLHGANPISDVTISSDLFEFSSWKLTKKWQLYYSKSRLICVKVGGFRTEPPVLQIECNRFILLAILIKCRNSNFG